MRKGRYGIFGGQYVSEMLMPALQELEDACEKILPDPGFQKEYGELLRDYAGRPTPCTTPGDSAGKSGAGST